MSVEWRVQHKEILNQVMPVSTIKPCQLMKKRFSSWLLNGSDFFQRKIEKKIKFWSNLFNWLELLITKKWKKWNMMIEDRRGNIFKKIFPKRGRGRPPRWDNMIKRQYLVSNKQCLVQLWISLLHIDFSAPCTFTMHHMHRHLLFSEIYSKRYLCIQIKICFLFQASDIVALKASRGRSKESLIIECEICSKKFRYQSDLKNHFESHFRQPSRR